MDIFRFTLDSIDSDDGGQRLFTGQGVSGEQLARVWHAQDFGFSSSPPVGSHGIGLAMLGRRDRVTAISVENPDYRHRNTVSGGSVLYDSSGNIVYARVSQGIQIRAAAGAMRVETPQSSIVIENGTGNIAITRGELQILMTGTRIDLGGPGGFRVMTEAGPSNKVFAIL